MNRRQLFAVAGASLFGVVARPKPTPFVKVSPHITYVVGERFKDQVLPGSDHFYIRCDFVGCALEGTPVGVVQCRIDVNSLPSGYSHFCDG